MKNEPWWSDVSNEERIAGVKKLEEENVRLRVLVVRLMGLINDYTERIRGNSPEFPMVKAILNDLSREAHSDPDVQSALERERKRDAVIEAVKVWWHTELTDEGSVNEAHAALHLALRALKDAPQQETV